MRYVLSFLALSLALACVPTVPPPSEAVDGEVLLRADKSGNRVELELDNGTEDRIGYNLCTSALERRTGSSWVNVPTDTMCTMELRTLSPGQKDRFTHQLPAGLSAGEYRFVTGVEAPLGAPQTSVVSNSFRVD